MKRNYYTFNKEELVKGAKIPLIVEETNEKIFKAMAEEMVAEIERKNALDEQTVFIIPVGPMGQYPFFVDLVNEKRLSLKNAWFINMDEYLDENLELLEESHSLSFRGFMEREVYSKIDDELLMPSNQRVFPEPSKLEFIPQLIEELGGVDITFGGIGLNGHVAFNEPQEELSVEGFKRLKTRIQKISAETRVANAIGGLNGALEEMPTHCVTIGMNEIYNAKKIRLGCFRDWHRGVIRRAAHGEETTEFPVTLLQNHKDVNVKLTDFVANLEG